LTVESPASCAITETPSVSPPVYSVLSRLPTTVATVPGAGRSWTTSDAPKIVLRLISMVVGTRVVK
jgi:hypothetical protein